MKAITRLTHRIAIPALMALLVIGAHAQADSHAPPPPGILEVWLCNYKDGKDMDDLMSARDFYLSQAERAGITPAPAYVWSLIKGDVANEVLWFNVHENLDAYGAASDAAAASEEMSRVTERFDTVTSCRSNIATFTSMFQRQAQPGGEDDDSVIVSSSACQFQHGRGDADAADLADHIGDVLSGMGDNTPLSVFMVDPITGGSQQPLDRVLFNVNADMSSWTSFIGALIGSADGQQLGRHFNAVFSCTSSLWAAQQVVGGNGEE